MSKWRTDGGNFKRRVGPSLVNAEVHKNPMQTNFDHVVEKRTGKGERQGLQRRVSANLSTTENQGKTIK